MGTLSALRAYAARWPRVLTWYILVDFLAHFAVILGGLVMVLTLGTIFDSLRGILKYEPEMWMILAYYACRVPYNVAASVPLAVLIATLLTLAKMLRSHELVAMRAGGMSQYLIAAPFLAAALVVSFLTLGFTETVLPWANRMARELKWVHIRKVPLSEMQTVKQAAVWTGGGSLVYADEANGEEQVLKGVTIFEFKGGDLTGRIDAETARPVRGMWEIRNAQIYRWRGDRPRLEREEKAVYPMLEGIKDFLQEDVPVENLTRGDLRALIAKLKKTGKVYVSEQVFYYFKLAYPFASFIVALLGLGVSFTFQTNPRSGVAASFGVAFFSALFYIGLVQLGQVLGVGGVLPPLIAVWLANAVFLVAGLALMWRAWKW